ncbi:MAG TPA: DUF6599 family protein [Candidatus Acidoferrales bacterium]
MRRAIPLLILFVLLAALPTSAQGILPSSFAGWTATNRGSFDGSGFPVINDDTTVPAPWSVAAAREYGFLSGERVNYARGVDESLYVELYRMKDPSGAYGEYSYLRKPDMSRTGPTDHSALSPAEAVVLVGNLVLFIQGSELVKDAKDLNVLVNEVSAKAQQGPLPTLTEHLPTKGLIERSDRYILGPVTLDQFFPVSQNDWLGFSTGAEAEVARYRVNGRELNLLIADFPTPQTAQKKLNELQQVYHVNAADGDQNGSPVFGKRSITLLAIVFGARTRAEADKLLEQVQSGAEVTWNEPTFQFKEPPITTMIVGAIIGTGIICCFALISGIAFGGFRIVVKRLFPDKVFDRSSTMQVLQLGLGSKPINSEDFYGIERNQPK